MQNKWIVFSGIVATLLFGTLHCGSNNLLGSSQFDSSGNVLAEIVAGQWEKKNDSCKNVELDTDLVFTKTSDDGVYRASALDEDEGIVYETTLSVQGSVGTFCVEEGDDECIVECIGSFTKTTFTADCDDGLSGKICQVSWEKL